MLTMTPDEMYTMLRLLPEAYRRLLALQLQQIERDNAAHQQRIIDAITHPEKQPPGS